jgi:hypothetical protein
VPARTMPFAGPVRYIMGIESFGPATNRWHGL